MNRKDVTKDQAKTGNGFDPKNPKQKLGGGGSNSPQITLNENEKEIILLHKIYMYYTDFFPFKDIYHWLNYGGCGRFEFREFTFTLVINETVCRNLSFRNYRAMIIQFLAQLPLKIDIGARYHIDPQQRGSTVVHRCAERELVFDIDLSDYDNVRECCSGGDICRKCWKYAALACKILDASFREDFGWKHIIWLFSGRRGIHSWVCDKEVRTLSAQHRRDIVEFYTVSTGNVAWKPALGSKKLHRHFRRSFEIAHPTFVRMCVIDQNILGTDQGVETFLTLIPAGSYRENVKKLILPEARSYSRWNTFFAYWELQKNTCSEKFKARPHLFEEIVLFYTYPRLDSDVTTEMGHLLKAPFSLHPKNLQICLPFDPTKVDEFDVSSVPRLDDLIDSITKPEYASNLPENEETSGKDAEISHENNEPSRENDNTSLDMFEDDEAPVVVISDTSSGSSTDFDDDVVFVGGKKSTTRDEKTSLAVSKDDDDDSVVIIDDLETTPNIFDDTKMSVDELEDPLPSAVPIIDLDSSPDIFDDTKMSVDTVEDMEMSVDMVEDPVPSVSVGEQLMPTSSRWDGSVPETLPQVQPTALMQKQKYEEAVKIFRNIVIKIDKSSK